MNELTTATIGAIRIDDTGGILFGFRLIGFRPHFTFFQQKKMLIYIIEREQTRNRKCCPSRCLVERMRVDEVYQQGWQHLLSGLNEFSLPKLDHMRCDLHYVCLYSYTTSPSQNIKKKKQNPK